MSTLQVNTLKTYNSAPPVIQNSSGTEVGTFCRAWVNFNGTGTVAIRASYNVSSITDSGAGVYGINFTTAFSDTNYVVTVGGSQDGFTATSNSNIGIGVPAASNIILACRNNADTAYVDYQYVTAAVFR